MRDVFWFGNGKADGHAGMKDILGSKGANLAEMTNLGVPVPPGFTIACSACMDYLATGGVPPALREEVAPRPRGAGGGPPRGAGWTPPIRCWYRCAAAARSPCPG